MTRVVEVGGVTCDRSDPRLSVCDLGRDVHSAPLLPPHPRHWLSFPGVRARGRQGLLHHAPRCSVSIVL